MGDTVASWRAVFSMSCPGIGSPLYTPCREFLGIYKNRFL
jgi:hypothetical protein